MKAWPDLAAAWAGNIASGKRSVFAAVQIAGESLDAVQQKPPFTPLNLGRQLREALQVRVFAQHQIHPSIDCTRRIHRSPVNLGRQRFFPEKQLFPMPSQQIQPVFMQTEVAVAHRRRINGNQFVDAGQRGLQEKPWRGCRSKVTVSRGQGQAYPTGFAGKHKSLGSNGIVVRRMTRGIQQLKRRRCQLPFGSDPGRIDRQHPSIGAGRLAKGFQRALPQSFRINDVGGALGMTDHGGVRKLFNQMSEAAGVVDMDVGQTDVIQAVHPQPGEGIGELADLATQAGGWCFFRQANGRLLAPSDISNQAPWWNRIN